MLTKPRIAILALPVALLVTLAGCGGGGSGGSSPGAGGGAGGLAGCAAGHVWNADIQNLADQLLAKLRAGGSPATSATGTGTQKLDWGADGRVVLTTDYTFTVVTPMSSVTMTLAQHHSGTVTGNLTLVGSVAEPSNWDASGYTVTTAIDIGGRSANSTPITIPSTVPGAAPLTVTCTGNVLTTFAQGGFATEKWTRVGG